MKRDIIIKVLCLLLLTGCGARKVSTNIDKSSTEQRNDVTDKTKTDETATKDSETQIKTEEKTQEKIESNTGLQFTSDKPVEITKDGIKFTPNGTVIYNTNSYYESIISHIRDSSSRVTDSLNRVIANDREEINRLEQDTYSKDKDTDSEGNVKPIALAIFGSLIVIGIAYFVYKYFTNPKRKL